MILLFFFCFADNFSFVSYNFLFNDLIFVVVFLIYYFVLVIFVTSKLFFTDFY